MFDLQKLISEYLQLTIDKYSKNKLCGSNKRTENFKKKYSQVQILRQR